MKISAFANFTCFTCTNVCVIIRVGDVKTCANVCVIIRVGDVKTYFPSLSTHEARNCLINLYIIDIPLH